MILGLSDREVVRSATPFEVSTFLTLSNSETEVPGGL